MVELPFVCDNGISPRRCREMMVMARGSGAFERYRAAAAGLRGPKKRLAKRITRGITLGRSKRAS
jgi:hypothetical protein